MRKYSNYQWLPVIVWCVAWLTALPAAAQTAQATLGGEVRNAQGQPLDGVRVFAENQETGAVTSAVTNTQGQYVLQFLPRGRYLLRVQAVGYRPVERRDVELHVAQRAVADFQLETLAPDLEKTLSAVEPEALARGGVALIYGPDAQAKLGVVDDRPPPLTDATSTTVSWVIDRRRIRDLPLAGRDIYTLFVLLPGVTSDNATQRGLGFSVNGFRVSSSNYLLDGVDNNNVQNTFPPTLLSPDAIDEYRLATNNFSAEYGRGAFVANVITRAGANSWHGSLFEFLINEKLNANSFQDNANSRERPPFKEHQFGYTLGGPLVRDRVFLFTALEALRASTVAAPQTVTVPQPAFLAGVTGPIARDLLERYPLLPLSQIQTVDSDRIEGVIFPHIPINTISGSARADFDLRPDRDRLFVRFGSFDQTFNNVTFSPYQDLGVPFTTASRNLAVGYVHRLGPGVVNEAKFGLNRNRNEFVPPAPGVPELSSDDGTHLPGNVAAQTEQSYTDNVLHFVENFSVLLARHHLVAGGEYRRTISSSLLAPLRIGLFGFPDLAAFAADRPDRLITTVDRFSTDRYRAPDYMRHYRQTEFAVFLQDNWRVSRRLTLNLGLRYEYFGVPHNTRQSEDVNFYLGDGATPFERVAAGSLRRTPDNPGDLRGLLYRKDHNNFAPRFGFAFDVFGNSRTVFRGGYGIYYDRIFNLVWDPLRQNNFRQVFLDSGFRYTSPASEALPGGPASIPRGKAFAVEDGLRTPYVQTWFAGVQHALTRNMLLEVNGTGSLAPGTYNSGIVITPSRFCTSTIFGPTTTVPVTLTITSKTAVPTLPANSVVNGSSFRPATDPNGAIAPGAIVALFGADLAGDTQGATVVPLPTTLGDTSVTFNNIAAPLYFVGPGQINAQVPFELMAGPGMVSVQVTRGTVSSETRSIGIATVSPGIFTLNQQGTGVGAILHAADFQPVSESAPALPGEFLLIFCTGLGLVQPEVQSGQIAPTAEPLARTVSTPLVNIAGLPAQVSFSGLAPGFVGLYQVNVQVPLGVPPGTQEVEIIINNVPANTVTIPVQ